MIIRPHIILLISFTLLSSSVCAERYDLKFAGGVDTTISDIATGGLWEEGTSYGNWRLVVRNLGWEHTRSFLYLQWLKTDDENKEIVELYTMPIREFNTGNWRNIHKIEYKDNGFFVYYTNRGQDGVSKSRIEPDVPGKYKIVLTTR